MLIVSPRNFHLLKRIGEGMEPEDAAREWDIGWAITQAFGALYPPIDWKEFGRNV
jgi:hypothetical protein